MPALAEAIHKNQSEQRGEDYRGHPVAPVGYAAHTRLKSDMAILPRCADIVEKARKLSNGMKGLGEAVTRVSMIL